MEGIGEGSSSRTDVTIFKRNFFHRVNEFVSPFVKLWFARAQKESIRSQIKFNVGEVSLQNERPNVNFKGILDSDS